MQTVNVKLKAGALKGIVDLPVDDDQLVNVTVSPETENKNRLDILTEKIIKARAQKNLEIMQEIQTMIGDNKGWSNEEEMIKDLAERRRLEYRESHA